MAIPVRFKTLKVEDISEEVFSQIRQTQEMYQRVSRYYVTSVLGGAPRDWWFNQRARDVDIFFRGGFESVDFYANQFGIPLVELGNEDLEGYGGNNRIFRVMESVGLATTFQFIILNGVPTTIDFPTSLSRYMYLPTTGGPEGLGDIVRSEGAAIGEEEKKIICRDRQFTPKEIRYLHKIWAKVPDYEIISDTEGLELAKEKRYVPQERRTLD